MRLFDVVEFVVDMPECGVKAGMSGTIVEILGGDLYLVEVFDNSNTVDVIEARSEQITLKIPFLERGEKVALDADMPDEKLQHGDIGTVVGKAKGGQFVDVAFSTLDGHPYRTLTIHVQQIRRLSRNEIAHVRIIE